MMGTAMGIKIPVLIVLTAILWTTHGKTSGKKAIKATVENVDCTASCQELANLKQAIIDLSKQVMMQQVAVEERARMDGYTGILVTRGTKRGPRNFDYISHLAPSAFTMHDHSNYDRTVGFGEISVTMNGINFRTRHNDYKLIKASTSKEYHTYEDIRYPDVPPEVLNKSTLQDQITEMRQWFKAFMDQDPSVRDYRKYFKPVMCYLEGSWTSDKQLEESFPSERHYLEAKTWEDLHEKFRFTAFTGVKSRLENNAFLPTCIIGHNTTTGLPEYAQWNYRILCHPLDIDIPTSYLIPQGDLLYSVPMDQTFEKVATTRAGRFKLIDPLRKTSNYQLMDEIFAKIPGPDNYGAHLNFTVFGEPMYETGVPNENVLLNAGYYHRSYKSFKNGAGGIAYTALGFNDENLWMAMTSQERVAAFQTEKCFNIINKIGKKETQCQDGNMRVSYAMPLEIIYLTPLLSWNPYNLDFHQDKTISVKDNRNGGAQKYQAFNGTDKSHYYRTPSEFFKGSIDKSDPADTVKNFVYILDRKGTPRKVSASGTKIILEEIPGLGKIRTRYAIAPISREGSTVWKELNALKFKFQNDGPDPVFTIEFEMSISVQDPPGEHTHVFFITSEEYDELLVGEKINVTTQEAQEHTHDLTIVYIKKEKAFKYTLCDGAFYCTDGHAPYVFKDQHA